MQKILTFLVLLPFGSFAFGENSDCSQLKLTEQQELYDWEFEDFLEIENDISDLVKNLDPKNFEKFQRLNRLFFARERRLETLNELSQKVQVCLYKRAEQNRWAVEE